jgi:hypothetical protein
MGWLSVDDEARQRWGYHDGLPYLPSSSSAMTVNAFVYVNECSCVSAAVTTAVRRNDTVGGDGTAATHPVAEGGRGRRKTWGGREIGRRIM